MSLSPARRRSLAEVDHQLVVKELLLHVGELAVEVFCREVKLSPREVAVVVLAKRNRPLLSVHHLECSVGVLDPVHDIERKALHHGGDHGIALLLLVDELALIGGSDVEQSAAAPHAALRVIDISVDKVAYLYSMQLDFHGVFLFFRYFFSRRGAECARCVC